jgi:hypothetical protein
MTVNGKKIVSMADILCVKACEKTFAEGKIVDRIKEIGLPNPIVPNEAIDFL